jgi:hypothetical protein
MAGVYAAFVSWAEAASRDIVAYAHPGFDYDARVTRGWAGTNLHEALIAVGLYLVVVAIGLKNYETPKGKPPKEVEGVALMVKEPIRFVQAIYNFTQVRSVPLARVEGGCPLAFTPLPRPLA